MVLKHTICFRVFSHLQPLESETPSLNLVNSFPLIKEKAYINGAWVGSSMGKTFEVKNPANGEVIANVPNLGDEETKLAINAAHEVGNRETNNRLLIVC